MAAASVTKSGTNLTLNLPMTFTAAYAGAKNTYMYAGGSSATSGWQTMGTWTVPAASGPPTTVSVTPSSGSGLQQTFALQYADPLGATDLSSVWVWITASFGPLSNTCLIEYASAANQLYLYNDAGTGWLSPATVGAAGTLSNSQCSINMAAASVTKSGTNLTLNLPMTFTAAYAGAKTTYMYAGGSIAASGWQTMGTWTVPAAKRTAHHGISDAQQRFGSPADVRAAVRRSAGGHGPVVGMGLDHREFWTAVEYLPARIRHGREPVIPVQRRRHGLACACDGRGGRDAEQQSMLDQYGRGERHEVGDESDLEPADDVHGGVRRSEDYFHVRGRVDRRQRMADDGNLDGACRQADRPPRYQ